MPRVRRIDAVVLVLIPAAATVYLGFRTGGFFAGSTGLAAAILCVLLVLRVTLVDKPFEGLSAWTIAAAAALGLLAVWTLISAGWSDSPSRAIFEYDRVLLYLLGLVIVGSRLRRESRLNWMLRLLALGITAVCVAGLATRLAPDTFPVAESVSQERLSWPLTYWNATGLLAALGAVLCLHLSSSEHERGPVRAIAAGALPALAAVVLLTFSRGAIAAGAAGLIVYVLAGRPRALLTALVAIVPTTYLAVRSAYGAELLWSETFPSDAAAEEGHDVAVVIGLCTLAAIGLRGALLPLDERLASARLPARVPRVAVSGAVFLGALALAGTALAVGAPDYIERQYDRFVEGDRIREGSDLRARLTNPGNNQRLNQWEVALDAFDREPLRGTGAGTYVIEWNQERPNAGQILDAHSLYVEVMGELGLPGLILVAGALLILLIGLALRSRGPTRGPPAVVLAAGVAWALHAGIDWDWEMPAVTFWFFAAAAACLAAPAVLSRDGESRARATWARDWAPGVTPRVLIALAVLVVAVTPVTATLSHRDVHRAIDAFRADDCAAAVDHSLSALDWMSSRTEPWEVIGYCDSKAGRHDLAIRALANAIDRDPDNWELYYGLALVRGAARQDPRDAAAMAKRLNPNGLIATIATERFDTRRRSEWEAVARSMPLPGI